VSETGYRATQDRSRIDLLDLEDDFARFGLKKWRLWEL